MIWMMVGALLSPDLVRPPGADSLRCFVVSDLPAAALGARGIRTTGGRSPYYAAWVQTRALEELRKDPDILYIQGARPVQALNDLAPGWSVSYVLSRPDTLDFTAPGPDSLQVIATYDPGGDLDPYAEVFDASWSLVASDQDGGWGRAARIETRLPAGGLYHLVVGAQSGSGDARVYLLSDAPLSMADGSWVHLGTGAWIKHRQGFTGQGVVIGFVDSGIDWDFPDFTFGGETKILYIWDQTLTPQGGEQSPPDFGYGVEYDSLDVVSGTPREIDDMGHGSHIAGTAAGKGLAGNGSEPLGRYAGMAPDAYIISVKTTWEDADVLDGVDYIFRRAEALGLPCVVNLSLGSHYGPHDGTSPFEAGLANLTGPGKIIVGSAGNSGSDPLHARVWVSDTDSVSFNAQSPPFQAVFYHPGLDAYKITFLPPVPSASQDWAYSPDSGTWGTGAGGDPYADYETDLTCFVESPGVNLAGTTDPILILVHSYDMGPGDGGVVEASRDGEVWEAITPTRGYPDSTGFEPAFVGSSGGSVEDTFSLSAYAGESLRVRFRMFSDPSGVSAGWLLDSVLVEDGGSPLFAEGFSTDSGGFVSGIVNSLVARPKSAPAAWVGAGASQGGGFVRVFYSDSAYPGNGCLFGEWEISGPSSPPAYTWEMILVRETSGGDGLWDAWRYGPGGSRYFLRGATLGGTLVEPGCSPKVLTVGAFGARTGWQSVDGTHYDALYGTVPFPRSWTSKGPTRDNRIKPDLVASGSQVSSASRDASWPLWLLSEDSAHALRSGTSMSAPCAAGAVALVLEAQPGLSPDEIIPMMRDWAYQDSITGFSPDTVWGWGRLGLPDSTFLRIKETPRTAGSALLLEISSSVSKGPVIRYSVPPGGFRVELYDIAGRRVATLVRGQGPAGGELPLPGNLSAGVYMAALFCQGHSAVQKLILLR